MNYSWSFLNYSYFCTGPETLPDMKEIQQEITPITNEDLFIILNHPNAHFDYPIHCHPEYEINLVMNTRGSRIVGDSTEDFGPLDLVMTGPYVPHVWAT